MGNVRMGKTIVSVGLGLSIGALIYQVGYKNNPAEAFGQIYDIVTTLALAYLALRWNGVARYENGN